ncbi:uncharacterized protein LOC119967833 isoform X1 [Scyliorhinus canicula]|uniref:uncharacterized protein LOC119967833 isoform X1 n=2 Tax=Scyliorhinus canicula TaxID=7830 RepID=UPI0018F59790|nr:uncharacterized protein LOC119967833 isoform X1 [Scyliorhinus canicula]
MGDSPTSDPMDLRPSRPVSSTPAPSPSPSLTPPFPPTSSNPIPPSTSPSSPSVSVSPSLRSDSPFPHTSNKDFAQADEKIEVALQKLHQKKQRQHAMKHSQSEYQNLGMPVNIMAGGSNEGADPTSKRMRMDTDLNSVFTEFLIKSDDYQLFKLMKFYWDRLEQAIEEGVAGISMLLTDKSVFSAQEYQKITELVEQGNRVDSSKLLLNLVMEKGSLARRVMWESFVKMRHGVPKLDKILKVIQEHGSDPFGYMDIAHDLSELSSHLKGKK